MQLSTILWFALLVLLAVLFAVTVRRMSALVARTRNLERFQRSVESIERRFTAAVVPLVRGLDETRRHAGNPELLREQLTAAQTILAELLAEARSLSAPAQLVLAETALAGQLERAARATDFVEHGLATMANPGRGRDLEAQVSLKRGLLNLRHAHEAFGRIAREVAAVGPADLAGGAPLPTVGATPLATYQGNDEDDMEGHFDPRM